MIEYIIGNWPEIAGVAAAVVLAFDRLAKLTPTKRDDQAINKLYQLFAVIGLKVKDNEGK